MNTPNWGLLLNAAEEFTSRGKPQFSRADLIRQVRRVDPTREASSLSAVVQGMTVNAPGGVSAACGAAFRRVDRGVYELLPASERGAAVESKPRPQVVPAKPPRVDIEGRIAELIDQFDNFVDLYDRQVPFTKSGQYALHRQTIDRRRRLGSASAALLDDLFLGLLYATLKKWGIGIRGSRLADLPTFRARLRARAAEIASLEQFSIEMPQLGVGPRLYQLVEGLGIVDNKAKIVAGSKTLHHILPDLIPPLDRRYTGAFFGWSALAPQYSQERIFLQAYAAFERIAVAVRPSRLVGRGWRTSSTKIIDNALVGFCVEHRLGGAP